MSRFVRGDVRWVLIVSCPYGIAPILTSPLGKELCTNININGITTSLIAPRNDSFAVFTTVVSVGWAF